MAQPQKQLTDLIAEAREYFANDKTKKPRVPVTRPSPRLPSTPAEAVAGGKPSWWQGYQQRIAAAPPEEQFSVLGPSGEQLTGTEYRPSPTPQPRTMLDWRYGFLPAEAQIGPQVPPGGLPERRSPMWEADPYDTLITEIGGYLREQPHPLTGRPPLAAPAPETGEMLGAGYRLPTDVDPAALEELREATLPPEDSPWYAPFIDALGNVIAGQGKLAPDTPLGLEGEDLTVDTPFGLPKTEFALPDPKLAADTPLGLPEASVTNALADAIVGKIEDWREDRAEIRAASELPPLITEGEANWQSAPGDPDVPQWARAMVDNLPMEVMREKADEAIEEIWYVEGQSSKEFEHEFWHGDGFTPGYVIAKLSHMLKTDPSVGLHARRAEATVQTILAGPIIWYDEVATGQFYGGLKRLENAQLERAPHQYAMQAEWQAEIINKRGALIAKLTGEPFTPVTKEDLLRQWQAEQPWLEADFDLVVLPGEEMPEITPYNPLDFEANQIAYLTEYDDAQRAFMEFTNPFLWYNPVGRVFAINNLNKMRKVAATAYLAQKDLPQAGRLVRGITRLDDIIRTPRTVTVPGTGVALPWNPLANTRLSWAQRQAEHTARFAENIVDSVAIQKRGKEGDFLVVDPDELVAKMDDFVTKEHGATRAPVAQELIRESDVANLPSIKKAKDGNTQVDMIDFQRELSNELLRNSMIKSGALKAGQKVTDYKPGFIERINGVQKTIESFFWLGNPRYIFRNAANGYFTQLWHGIGPFLNKEGFTDFVKVYGNLAEGDELARVMDLAESYGLTEGVRNIAFRQQRGLTGRLADVPIRKQLGEVASGTGALGEAGQRLKAEAKIAMREIENFWLDQSSSYYMGPRKANIELPDGRLLSDVNPEVDDFVKTIYERSLTPAAAIRHVEDALRGQKTPIHNMLPPDHNLSFTDINTLQTKLDNAGSLDERIKVLDEVIDEVKRTGDMQYVDPSPTIASDFLLDDTHTMLRDASPDPLRASEINRNIRIGDEIKQIQDDFLLNVMTGEKLNHMQETLPYVVLRLQRYQLRNYQGADRIVNKYRRLINVEGGNPDVLWPRYDREIRDYWVKANEELRELTVEMGTYMREVSDGTRRRPRRVDNPFETVMREMDAWHTDYAPPKGEDPRHYKLIGRERREMARVQNSAFEFAMTEAEKGNLRPLSYYMAASAEADRVAQIGAAHVARIRKVTPYDERTKIWRAIRADMKRIYAQVEAATRRGRAPDFTVLDEGYDINRLITGKNRVDNIRHFAKEADIYTATPKGTPADQHLINTINKDIRTFNETYGTSIRQLNVEGKADDILMEMTQEQYSIAYDMLRKRSDPGWLPYGVKSSPHDPRGMLPKGTGKLADEAGINARDLPDANPATVGRQEAANRRSKLVDLEQVREQIIDLGDDFKEPYFPEEQIADVVAAIRGNLGKRMADMRTVVKDVSRQMGDNIMLNYGDRRNIDALLEILFPYQYWWSRSAFNWGKRLTFRPNALMQYLDYQRNMDRQVEEDPRYTNRMKGKIRVSGDSVRNIAEWAKIDAETAEPYAEAADWIGETYIKARGEVAQIVTGGETTAEEYVEDYAPEMWVQDPIRSMILPFEGFRPDNTWDDPADANNNIEKFILTSRMLGLGSHMTADFVMDRIMNDPNPGLVDVIGSVGSVANILTMPWANGGTLFGPLLGTKYDLHRWQRSVLNEAAAVYGIDEAWRFETMDELEAHLRQRGDVDMELLLPYTEVAGGIERLIRSQDPEYDGQGYEWDQELFDELRNNNEIGKEAANSSAVNNALKALSSFLSGVGFDAVEKGEIYRRGVDELVKSKGYFPEDGLLGSQEAMNEIRELAPESWLNQSDADSAHWRMVKQNGYDKINNEYRSKMDALIRAHPANFEKQAKLRDQWTAAKDALEKQVPKDAIKSDKLLWSVWGATPTEIRERRMTQARHELARLRPKTEEFWEYPDEERGQRGEFDSDGYEEALAAYEQNMYSLANGNEVINAILNEYGADVRGQAAFMDELMDAQAQQNFLESEHWKQTPLDVFITELKDAYYEPGRLRWEAAAKRTGIPDIKERVDAYWLEADKRFGNEAGPTSRFHGMPIQERSAAYWDAVEQHWPGVFELQEQHFAEREQKFPNIDKIEDHYNSLKKPNGDTTKKSNKWLGNTAEGKLLRRYWKWYYETPEVQQKYSQVFDYWAKKGALQKQYGVVGFLENKDLLREKHGVGPYYEIVSDLHEEFPAYGGGSATDFLEVMKEDHPWLAEQYEDEVLLEILGEIAPLPDTDLMYLINEAERDGRPLQELIAEEEAKLPLPGEEPPAAEEEGEGKKKKRGRRRGYYSRGGYYRRGYYRRGYGGYGGGGSSRRPSFYVPSYRPGTGGGPIRIR